MSILTWSFQPFSHFLYDLIHILLQVQPISVLRYFKAERVLMWVACHPANTARIASCDSYITLSP